MPEAGRPCCNNDLGCPTVYNGKMPSKFNARKHHRRSIRLPNYDYSQAGAYYMTIVVWHRECLFGEVVNGEMKLNRYGEIVQHEWLELPKCLLFVKLGVFMVMPNHFHGILFFFDSVVGATHPGITESRLGKMPFPQLTTDGIDGSPLPRGAQSKSLGAIMAQFKSRVTKRLWKFAALKGTPVWQRNYYEHIIRDEQDLKNKIDYILSNPMLWDEDDENPNNIQP
jgi:REP element-mobilizing transposase RayT